MTRFMRAYWLTGAILAIAVAQPAAAITIEDRYYGADDHNLGDVIGTLGNFQIDSMDVTNINNMLTVTIKTDFAGKADDGLFTGITRDNKGIGYGDLFLHSSWDPFGSAPYLDDDVSTGTQWSYALSLDNRWSATGGTASLYSLIGDDSDVLLSDYFLTGGTYRNGQEVAVDTTGKTAIRTGGWTVDEVAGTITFTMDLSGTDLADSNVALHWGMTCANDVIEGVPAPIILLLMATGLFGVGVSTAVRRKRA